MRVGARLLARGAGKWFSEEQGGFAFKCTRCGQCCTGPSVSRDGGVRISTAEAAEAANSLQLSLAAFLHLHTSTSDGELVLKRNKTDSACSMLDSHNRCSIHASKPTSCSSYPFLPETLRSAQAWRAESAVCEGINHPSAEHVPFEEARRLAVAADIKRAGDEEFSSSQALELLESVPEDMLTEWDQGAEESVVYDDEHNGVRVVERDDDPGARSLICDSAPQFEQARVVLDPEGEPLLGTLSPELSLLHSGFHASDGGPAAVIGAGGFVLPNALSFEHTCTHVDAVEPSEAISQAARSALGATSSPKLHEHRELGERYLERVAAKAEEHQCWNFIAVDAAAGDASQSLIAPVEPLVDKKFLQNTLPRCMRTESKSVCAIGAIASEPWLREIRERLCKAFKHVAIAELSSKKVFYISDNTLLEHALRPPSRVELFGEEEEWSRKRQRKYAVSILQ